MPRATIFLRQPAGVAIRTDDVVLSWPRLLAEADVLDIRSEKGVYVAIPVDNVASIEWT